MKKHGLGRVDFPANCADFSQISSGFEQNAENEVVFAHFCKKTMASHRSQEIIIAGGIFKGTMSTLALPNLRR